MNDKTLESISNFIEKKLDIAVADSVVRLINGRLSDKDDLMYLTPDDNGMLRLVVHDFGGEITKVDMNEPALVVDPMQLLLELKDSIEGNCGEPSTEAKAKYRAAIYRMEETCLALRMLLSNYSE